VSAEIRSKWLQLGAENFGVPITDREYNDSSQFWQYFQNLKTGFVYMIWLEHKFFGGWDANVKVVGPAPFPGTSPGGSGFAGPGSVPGSSFAGSAIDPALPGAVMGDPSLGVAVVQPVSDPTFAMAMTAAFAADAATAPVGIDLFAVPQVNPAQTLSPSDFTLVESVPGIAPAKEVMKIRQMTDFTNVRFSLTSPSWKPGSTQELLIQSQTNHADRTATFTGAWDAPAGPTPPWQVTGKLSYDNAGNVHIHFTYQPPYSGPYVYTFDGTITTGPFSHHLDAYLDASFGGVPVGGGPDHVIGDQILMLEPVPALVPPAGELKQL
jgi:hypothetical protein